ncbi:hypothetical protein PI124_g245 [Phytophthora idaei]|nr:hypothetical protein PI125_g118 [Phytophthora idaei]KAG3175045.1 hypothetical protein PI126_g1 [Phytophthora idaei]KAG3255185.1 hypothetical protein PI124_g245 [Phytophthora idaei]
MTDELSVDVSNAEGLQQAVVRVMTRHAAARPINTIKQYKRTVLDGYNLEDTKALSTFWLNQNTTVSLWNRVDFWLAERLGDPCNFLIRYLSRFLKEVPKYARPSL